MNIKEFIRNKWNLEVSGDDLMVCYNDHEKGRPCEYQTLLPRDIEVLLDSAKNEILKLRSATYAECSESKSFKGFMLYKSEIKVIEGIHYNFNEWVHDPELEKLDREAKTKQGKMMKIKRIILDDCGEIISINEDCDIAVLVGGSGDNWIANSSRLTTQDGANIIIKEFKEYYFINCGDCFRQI